MAVLDFLASDPRQVWALDRSTGEARHILEGEARELRAHAKVHLRCPFPGCTGPITTVGGEYVRDHFRHQGDVDHPGGLESLHHIESKQMLARWFREHGPSGTTAVVEAGVEGTARRADVLVTAQVARPLVLEIEYKSFTGEEARRKHQEYADAGINCLWLVGHSRVRASPPGEYVTVPSFAMTLRRLGARVLVVNPTRREIGTLLRRDEADWPWLGDEAVARLAIDRLDDCAYHSATGLETPASRRLGLLVEEAEREREDRQRRELAAAEAARQDRVHRATEDARALADREAEMERRRSLYAVRTRTREDLAPFMELGVVQRPTRSDDAFETTPEHWKAAVFAECVAHQPNWNTFGWAEIRTALARHGVPRYAAWSSPQLDAGRAFLEALEADGWIFIVSRREFASSGRPFPERVSPG